MKLILFVVVLCGAAKGAQRTEVEARQEVEVYVVNKAPVSGPVVLRATAEAAKIFAGVGVKVRWHEGRPHPARTTAVGCPKDASVVVTIGLDTPESLLPGAAAAATLGTGSITVFYDRIRSMVGAWPRLVPTFLAHVLVHEITHELEGVNRHAEVGIMKRMWTVADYHAMEESPLPFTLHDVELIRSGITTRSCPAYGGASPFTEQAAR